MPWKPLERVPAAPLRSLLWNPPHSWGLGLSMVQHEPPVLLCVAIVISSDTTENSVSVFLACPSGR